MRGQVLRRSVVAGCIAGAMAGCADDPTDVSGVTITVTGHVHALDSTPVGSLQAHWRTTDGQIVASVPVLADGTFSLSTPAPEAYGEILIDGPEPRSFHPFLFPYRATGPVRTEVFMVPLRWTVKSGIFQGQHVETPLDPVVDDDADNTFFTYYRAQPHPRSNPDTYLIEAMAWPAGGLPARVAIDHRHSTVPVPPSDSARMWAVLDRMEEVFGLNLFEPAIADSIWWPEPWRIDEAPLPGVIRLVREPPAWHGIPHTSLTSDIWEDDLEPWAEGGRFSAFRVTRDLIDAGTLIVGEYEPLRLADGFIPWETVFIHETLHVLGLGHTSRVPSPQGPFMRTMEPSPQDVAYTELMREIVAQSRAGAIGLIPAIIGDRRIIRGLPALPDLN